MPVDNVFKDLESICVSISDERRIRNGNTILPDSYINILQDGTKYRMYNQNNEFLAIYEYIVDEQGKSVLKSLKSFFEAPL